MAKAVFVHKLVSAYDDLPEERYHFPATYRRQVEAAVGDFILYYEPGRTGTGDARRTGRRAYVATVRVIDVRPDPSRSDHFYAILDPATFIDFDCAVPFRDGAHYYERQLRREDGRTSKGAFGRAVRPISDAAYDEILRAGFAHELRQAEAGQRPAVGPGLAEPPAPLFERPLVERLLTRPLRDEAFRRIVQHAYGSACAMTGLRIINGGGHAEVQAAHIRPVHDRGPDTVRNGLALSATVHWMFDRGLISVGPPPRHEILFASKGLGDDVMRLFGPDRRLRLPTDPRSWPAPAYLDYHRQAVFKG